jgi:hypothetical protein
MKKSDLTTKQKLFVPFPVCAAGVGEHCRMYSGFGARNEAHSERKYFAMQAIDDEDGAVTQRERPRSGAMADGFQNTVSEVCRIERWFIPLHASIRDGKKA